MARLAIIALAAATAQASPVAAQVVAASAQPTIEAAKAVLEETRADFTHEGEPVLGGHAPDLERTLAGAAALAQTATLTANATEAIVLLDGPQQMLVALAEASEKRAPADRRVSAIESPYPETALLLGSWYNEAGRPEDALRVLDVGLALPTERGGLIPGAFTPLLLSERGAALVTEKRWSDALANYDEGLALREVNDRDRARLLRGRGFALTELSRLDEAEAAYHDSLGLDPGNSRAQSEVAYIARLRAGAPREKAVITLPPPSPK